jgi:hypothetical protein
MPVYKNFSGTQTQLFIFKKTLQKRYKNDRKTTNIYRFSIIFY